MDSLRVDHIGIAVPDIEASRERLGRLFDLEPSPIEDVASEGVRVSFFLLGDVRIELLEPTRPDSSIQRFLDRGRPGVHHVALRVEGAEIESALARLSSAGFPVLGDGIRRGSGGSSVLFVHPKSTDGVLFEFIRAAEQALEAADAEAARRPG